MLLLFNALYMGGHSAIHINHRLRCIPVGGEARPQLMIYSLIQLFDYRLAITVRQPSCQQTRTSR